MCADHMTSTGKKLLGRSHVRSVAQKRLVGINEYCKVMMISLMDHMSYLVYIDIDKTTTKDI